MVLDNFKGIEITWDKANQSFYQNFRAASSDTKGRMLRVKILDEGREVEIGTGASLNLYWEHDQNGTNGLDLFRTVNILGQYELYYTTGMLSNVGTLRANLVFREGDSVVTSEPFEIEVFKGYDTEAIQSSNSFTALDSALARVQAIVEGSENVAIIAPKSLTANEIKNGAITREVLADNYADGGLQNAGVNLDTFYSEGNYRFAAPITGTLPSNWSGDGFVKVYKTQNRWVMQEIYSLLDPQTAYIRRVDASNGIARQWYMMGINGNIPLGSVSTGKIANKAITVDKIADNYDDHGIYTGDIDHTYASGKYALYAPITGTMPNDWRGSEVSGILDVMVTQNRWTYQTLTDMFDPSYQYLRRLDKNNGTVGAWHKYTFNGNNSGSASHLADKKIVFLGDSMTELGQYPEIVQQRTGATVYNCGFSGTRMSQHATNYIDFSAISLADAIATGDWTKQDTANTTLNFSNYNTLKNIDWTTVDYLSIFYGTNDWAGTIGTGSVTLGDETSTDKNTFYGAISYVVDKILTAHPHIKIMMITPTYRSRISPGDGLNSDDNPNRNGDMLVDFVDAIKYRAEQAHVPTLDLYRNSGINKWTVDEYTSDGLHPSIPEGKELIGDKVASYMLSNF